MTSKKILTPARAQEICLQLLKQNKHVVFTNGCFDILHAGHVQYLEAAREKGDFLILALDTDDAVRKLKGKGRPINSLKFRMKVMAALECVDAVTWFSNANPLPLIKKLKPRILVKGGDWKIQTILGYEEVTGWGGKVFSLPFLKGKSTTGLIETICNRYKAS